MFYVVSYLYFVLLASYFILDFFKKYTNYTENINEKDIIAIYEI